MHYSRRFFLLSCIALWGGCGDSSNTSKNANSTPSDLASEGDSVEIDARGVDTALKGAIKVDGSSTVYKISQAAAEEYGNVAEGVNISVAAKGTGGGMKEFVKGHLDICDASRPIAAKEIAECQDNGVEYFELPIAFDAITIAVNPKNNWLESLTIEKLKEIWAPGAQEKKRWSDFDPTWPDKEIHLFGADTDSGTWEYFTEAVMGKKGEIRSDYTAAANDNVIIKGVEGDQYALGFVPYAYFAPRKKSMKALKISWQDKDAVLPSVEAVKDGSYAPLSRPLFIYVNRQSAERPEVASFVDFYLKNGRAISLLAKYIPFPADAYPKVSARFANQETGTAFGGKAKFGLHIDEVLALPVQ